MILDFSKCKTAEDVEAVFAKAKPELDALRRGIASLTAKGDREAPDDR